MNVILRFLTASSGVVALGKSAKFYLEGDTQAAYYALLCSLLFGVITVIRWKRKA